MVHFSTRSAQGALVRMLRGLSPVLLVCAALLGSACHPKITDPKDPNFVVAAKGDWKVTRAQLDAELNMVLKQHQTTAQQLGPEKMPVLETEMLDNIVLKKLILDKAAAMNLKDADLAKDEAAQLDQLKGPATDAELAEKLKSAGMTLDDLKQRIHEKILITKVLQAEAFQNTEPTEQEITDIYMKYRDQFNIPAKIRASRVLVMVNDKTSPADKAAKKKVIDAARARVAKGEDFAKVATEVSEDRFSAPRGGDINWFQRGENEPQFDEVAFNSKVGVLSPVFETPLGYQFLKITATQPAGVVPLADARAVIAQKLRESKMGLQQEAYGKKLLKDSGVTFYLVRAELPAQPQPPGAAATDAPPSTPAPAPADSAVPVH